MKKFGLKLINGIIIAAFWLGLWEIISLFVKNDLVFPGPVTVFKSLGTIIATKTLWISILRSFSNVFFGFLIGNVSAILLGTLSYRFSFIRKIAEPCVALVKATPVASFIVVVLIILGREKTPLFISFLMVFPVIYYNVLTGLASHDKSLLEVANVYSASRLQIIRHVYIPAAFPGYIGAVKTGLGLSWKAGIAAEVLCNTKNTLGGEIYYSKVYLETPELFAYTAIIIIISIIFEKLTVYALNKIVS